MVKSKELLQKDLEHLSNELTVLNDSVSSLEQEADKIDADIALLNVKRAEIDDKLRTAVDNRNVKIAQIDEVRAQLAVAVSDEEFPDSMLDLAREFLGVQTMRGIVEIDESLSSFRAPVSLKDTGLNVDTPADEDLPWADGGVFTEAPAEIAPSCSNGGVFTEATAGTAPSCADGGVFTEALAILSIRDLMTKYGVEVDGKFVVPLSDSTVVGSIIQELWTRIDNCVCTISVGGKQVNADLRIVDVYTNAPVVSGIERVRFLYAQALAQWVINKRGVTSAIEMFDYFVGQEYTEIDGVAHPVGRNGLVYHLVVSPDGDIIKRVHLSSEPKNSYVIYEDKEGYKVIAGVMWCTKFQTVCNEAFRCYFPGVVSKYRSEKTRNMLFSQIFADDYVVFEEVQSK